MAKRKIRMLICGRKPDTSLLIAGIDAHICDKCIEQAHGIVLEELKSTGSKLAGDLILKKPKEIRAFLDQYVIGQDQTKK
jgi:ATP-dependent Clp protease ATP-binding subunit ClpX